MIVTSTFRSGFVEEVRAPAADVTVALDHDALARDADRQADALHLLLAVAQLARHEEDALAYQPPQ